jgi:TetR/AcrR family fatty acid metabolism transcriptional regulator
LSEPLKDDQSVAWRRRKDARGPEILAAARAKLEKHGAANTSMASIAKAAGVSEATVYKYFQSKEALLNQVLEDWAMPFIERLQSEMAQVRGVRSRLILIALRFLRALEETPKLHRVFFQELRWSNYRDSPLHRINRLFTNTVIETVEDGIRSGELHPGVDASIFRDMLFGGLEHIGIRTSFAGRQIDIADQAARYVDFMLEGGLARAQDSSVPEELSRLSALIDRLEAQIK